MTPDAAPYSPTRGLWVWLRGGWYRMRCGRRFGHFPVSDEWSFPVCGRCGTPLL